MKKIIFASLLSVIAMQAATAADQAPTWPANAMDENDVRVIAFYQSQCGKWANEQQIQGEARDAYLVKCNQSMPEVSPVGVAGGGDE